jgi:hypothetical protein
MWASMSPNRAVYCSSAARQNSSLPRCMQQPATKLPTSVAHHSSTPCPAAVALGGIAGDATARQEQLVTHQAGVARSKLHRRPHHTAHHLRQCGKLDLRTCVWVSAAAKPRDLAHSPALVVPPFFLQLAACGCACGCNPSLPLSLPPTPTGPARGLARQAPRYGPPTQGPGPPTQKAHLWLLHFQALQVRKHCGQADSGPGASRPQRAQQAGCTAQPAYPQTHHPCAQSMHSSIHMSCCVEQARFGGALTVPWHSLLAIEKFSSWNKRCVAECMAFKSFRIHETQPASHTCCPARRACSAPEAAVSASTIQ